MAVQAWYSRIPARQVILLYSVTVPSLAGHINGDRIVLKVVRTDSGFIVPGEDSRLEEVLKERKKDAGEKHLNGTASILTEQRR